MSKWTTLPTEILNIVFESIPQKDNRHCSMTCRSWRLAAQCVLFENIPALTDQQMSNLATALSNNNSSQSPGNFVKAINCNKFEENFDIDILNTSFPFLERIVFDRFQRVLCEKVFELVEEGKFPNLITAPIAQWSPNHMEFVLARKEHIKVLELQSKYGDFSPEEMFKKLHLLNTLEILDVTLYAERSIPSLQALLSNISSTLKSIRLLFRSFAEFTCNPLLSDSSSIQPLLNVSHLTINSSKIRFGGEEAYSYIMEKFPNLETFNVITRENLTLTDVNYKVPPVACLLRFLIYLFNVEKTVVRQIVTDQYTNEVVKTFFDYVSSQRTSIEVYLDINFEAARGRDVNSYPADRTSYISISSGFHLGGFHRSKRKEFAMQVNYLARPGYTHQTLEELLQEIGNVNLKCLSIGSTNSRSEPTYNAPIDLHIIFDYFTNLKALRINQSNNINILENISTLRNKLPSTLHSLEFYECSISISIFPKISARCSSLKILKFKACRFANHHIPINMASTRLEELSFDMCSQDFISSRPYESIFIRLQTAHKQPRYCKINLKDRHTLEPDWEKEDGYKLCLTDETCLVFDVYCEAVTRLTAKAYQVNEVYLEN